MFNADQTIAAISAAGAVLAAVWARSSAVSAKKALRISEKESQAKEEDLSAYLIDALKWRDSDSESFLSVSCSITNRSAVSTSISEVMLMVHAFDAQGLHQEVLAWVSQASPQGADFSLLSLPINLDSRNSVSGWLSFRIPSSIKGFRVERYEVLFNSWSGKRSILNIYQVKTLPSNENGTNQ